MVEFRTIEQMEADFLRRDPSFAQVTVQNPGTPNEVSALDYLSGLLSDDPLGDVNVYASGGGPVVFDLGILKGEEWEGVNRFLNSRLVSDAGRREFEQFKSDIQAADGAVDGVQDGYVTNQELVTFARAHSDRWPTVMLFRSRADILLNRVPAYLAMPNSETNPQANLNDEQVSRLWGVLNHLAGEYAKRDGARGTDPQVAANRTVYGLSLSEFPSADRDNPPDLIRRALNGTLSPRELAAVSHVLKTRMGSNGEYIFEGDAPITPQELEGLDDKDPRSLKTILLTAASKGHEFRGMKLASGDAEEKILQSRNDLYKQFLEAAQSSDPQAFEKWSAAMNAAEADHPETISPFSLLARAYIGELSPAETRLLRAWMKDEAERLDLTCSGTADCLAMGAKGMAKAVWEDKWHFLLRNGVFIGGSYLYHRLALRNAFKRGLEKHCGGSVDNAGQAYRGYENFRAGEMAKSALWKRGLDQLIRNPKHKTWWGKTLGFPVTFGHLAFFNYVASKKDTGKDWIDIPTDLPLIPLFSALDTLDAFNQNAIARYAAQNPGICKPAEPSGKPAPAPEKVVEAKPSAAAQPAEFSMFPDALPLFEDPLASLGFVPESNGGMIYRHSILVGNHFYGLPEGLESWSGQSFSSVEDVRLALADPTADQIVRSLALKGPGKIEVPSVGRLMTENEAAAAAFERAGSAEGTHVNGVPAGGIGKAAPAPAPVWRGAAVRITVP